MQIYFSLLVAVLGLLLYFLATRPKWDEVGRMMFFCGLLAFLLTGGVERVISVIPQH